MNTHQQQWFFGFHFHKAFLLSYSSLLQAQDSLPHTTACIISISVQVYIWRYKNIGDGLSETEYIVGRLWLTQASSHYMKYTLILPQLLVSLTLAEHSQIHALCVVPHALLSSVHRFTQCVGFHIHSCQALIDSPNQCGSSWPGIPSYPLPFFLHTSSQNGSFPRILFRCCATCGRVLLIGCESSNYTFSPYSDYVSIETNCKVLIMRTWRQQSCLLQNTLGGGK